MKRIKKILIMIVAGIILIIVGIVLSLTTTTQPKKDNKLKDKKPDSTIIKNKIVTYDCVSPDEKQNATLDIGLITYNLKRSYHFTYGNDGFIFGQLETKYVLEDASYIDKILFIENNSNVKPNDIKIDKDSKTKTYIWYIDLANNKVNKDISTYLNKLKELNFVCNNSSNS